MTEQLFVFSCRDVRKYAFDYRRGELHDAERRKFEEHVEACENCRDYVDRIEGMLDAAATHDFSEDLDRDRLFDRVMNAARTHAEATRDDLPDAGRVDAPVDRDELFDRITAEIATAEVATGETNSSDRQPVVELGQYGDAGEEPAADARRDGSMLLYVAAALAAGILIGLAMPLFAPDEPTAPTSADRGEVGEPKDRDERPAADDPRVAVDLADLTLQPTPSHITDVKVFGEPRANWSIRSQGARRQLELASGTVLVEFVGGGDRELELTSDRFTVRVTGTIFYASTERRVVGVVAGSVDVETRAGETVELVDGQEWVDGVGLRQAERDVRANAEQHVVVEEHRRALKEAAPPEPPPPLTKRPDAPRPPMSKEVVETPTSSLRESADRALREGRYDVAAQYFERMVEEFSAADPANASLRLDLARIYIRHLREPDRARVHLRRFVLDRPDDAATPSARDELCRIVEETDESEPLCGR